MRVCEASLSFYSEIHIEMEPLKGLFRSYQSAAHGFAPEPFTDGLGIKMETGFVFIKLQVILFSKDRVTQHSHFGNSIYAQGGVLHSCRRTADH